MAQSFIVPSIYQDISNQSQGYFAFRFTCQECYWSIDTTPIRSSVSIATDVMDIGVGFLGGFWGRAAEAGEQVYGSQWHQEQAGALQKAWAEVSPQFHLCPKCHRTVCMRCFNVALNLCTGPGCAPDLRADGSQFQHQMNIEAQRGQIAEGYHAPQFNINNIPSAVTPDMVIPPQQQQQALPPNSLSPAAIAGFSTPGYPKQVMCPTCRKMGPPGKFCQDCGTKLPLPDLICPNGAAPVENAAHFRSECGTKLQQTT